MHRPTGTWAFMTPIDQTVHHSPLIRHRRAVWNVLPLLRCSLSSTTTAKTTHKHPVMNTIDIYQLLLPGDNRKILLTGLNLNEVLKWTTLISSECRLNKLLILYLTSSFMISRFATSIFSPLAAEICSHDVGGSQVSSSAAEKPNRADMLRLSHQVHIYAAQRPSLESSTCSSSLRF